MRNPYTTLFDIHNPAHSTVAFWRQAGTKHWKTNARHYAREYGEARVLRADGSVVRFWRDAETGTVRQRTYHNVIFTGKA